MTNSTEQAIRKILGEATDDGYTFMYPYEVLVKRIESLIEAETLKARIEELTVLANHLLGDLYDKNDTSLQDNQEVREKIFIRLSVLQSQRKDKDG